MIRNANRRTAGKIAVFCVLMLGFGYALVPLYDALCDLTGLSGSTSNLNQATEPVEDAPVASDREVTLQFVTAVNQAMPWEFRPDQFEMKVLPGKTYRTVFHARNRTEHAMAGQAVPAVAPTAAAPHLIKQECFCFNRQELGAGEQVAMPLVFRVSPKLPTKVNTLTLSYTFFDVTNSQPS